MLALVVAAPVEGLASAAPAAALSQEPAAWIVVDDRTGKVLAARNHHARRRPASMSKLLTALVARRDLPANAGVRISARADATPGSTAGAVAGDVWPLPEAYHGMLLPSGNDVSYATAERVAGSVEAFGARMADVGNRLRLVDAPVLNDPAGFDGTSAIRGGNLISAFDMAVVARSALGDPVLRPTVATRWHTVSGARATPQTLSNTNRLLGTYAGAAGVKTGTTSAAGQCLVAFAQRGDRRIVVVVMGAVDRWEWAAKLLDDGFATPSPSGGERLPARRDPSGRLLDRQVLRTTRAAGWEPRRRGRARTVRVRPSRSAGVPTG